MARVGGGSQSRVIVVVVVGVMFLSILHFGSGVPGGQGSNDDDDATKGGGGRNNHVKTTIGDAQYMEKENSETFSEPSLKKKEKSGGGGAGGRYHQDDLHDIQRGTESPLVAHYLQDDEDGGDVISKRENKGRTRGLKSCNQANNCHSCLFDTPLDPEVGGESRSFPSSHDQLVAPVPLSSCVWCASRSQCMHAGTVTAPKSFLNVQDYKGQFSGSEDSATTCDDIEDASCPAVILSPSSGGGGSPSAIVPPQNIRVIHVAIRKGGPEALVQIFLALSHWGFKTTLDTRKSKKEKGGEVVPFFKTVYKDEFANTSPLRWVKDYEDWTASGSEGDILLATETWRCPVDGIEQLGKGVRYMQWHLTVWPRRDRSSCTIATHTHYIAVDYMRQSARSLMFPYISPHIVKLALAGTNGPDATTRGGGGWKSKKTNLIMYDSDTKLKDKDLTPVTNGVKHDTKIATGYTPEALYELYGKMKAGIDLRLPGGERMVYEAALFDVCIVVDSSSNGGDALDFPIPERFRVAPESLPALNKAKDECVSKYSSVIDEFLPFKNFVLSQRATFYRQVRRYFSNSVHVVTKVGKKEDLVATTGVINFIAAVITQFPFATVEVQVPIIMLTELGVTATGTKNNVLRAILSLGKNSAHSEAWRSLSANSYLASVSIVPVDGFTPKEVEGRSYPLQLLQPRATSPKQSLYTLVLPHLEQCLFAREDTIHLLGSLLYKAAGSAAAPGRVLTNGDGGLIFGKTETIQQKYFRQERLAASTTEEVSGGFKAALRPILIFSSAVEDGSGKEAKDFLCQHIVPREVMVDLCKAN